MPRGQTSNLPRVLQVSVLFVHWTRQRLVLDHFGGNERSTVISTVGSGRWMEVQDVLGSSRAEVPSDEGNARDSADPETCTDLVTPLMRSVAGTPWTRTLPTHLVMRGLRRRVHGD